MQVSGAVWFDERLSMELKDKIVIVTGAGSGVGRALALEFGRNGACVVAVGRRLNRIQETVTAIEA